MVNWVRRGRRRVWIASERWNAIVVSNGMVLAYWKENRVATRESRVNGEVPAGPWCRFGGVAGRVHVLVASGMRLMLPVDSGGSLWLLKLSRSM